MAEAQVGVTRVPVSALLCPPIPPCEEVEQLQAGGLQGTEFFSLSTSVWPELPGFEGS